MGTMYPDFQHATYHDVGDGTTVFDSYPPAQEIDLTPQDPTAVSPFSTIPQGHYGQWWSPDDASFAATADMMAPNVYAQAEPQFSSYTLNPDTPTQWPSSATSIHSYPLPSPSTDVTSVEMSVGGSGSRRGSTATQPEKRKRTRKTGQSVTEKPATSSRATKRGSTRKTPKSEATEKPKTRGPKPKLPPFPEVDNELDELDELEFDDYSRKVQERNRIASNKFRLKKREDAKRLRADEEDMERANSDLTSCVSDLTMQVYELKMRLLQHTDCDCHLIQDYIANEAQRYIKDLGDGKQIHATPPIHFALSQSH